MKLGSLHLPNKRFLTFKAEVPPPFFFFSPNQILQRISVLKPNEDEQGQESGLRALLAWLSLFTCPLKWPLMHLLRTLGLHKTQYESMIHDLILPSSHGCNSIFSFICLDPSLTLPFIFPSFDLAFLLFLFHMFHLSLLFLLFYLFLLTK